jgi:uncharacterized protein (TIGR00297 family)
LFFVLIGIFLVIGLVELMRLRLNGSAELTRKFVHLGFGVMCSYTPQIFRSGIPALLVASVFIVVNALALRSRGFKAMHGTERRSYGTVWFPVSYFLLVVLFWDREPAILVLAMLVLTFGDAAAAFAGGQNKAATLYNFNGNQKSIEGSLAMLAVSFVTLFAGIHYLGTRQNFQLDYAVGLSLAGALTATAWEALSSRGFDNFTVPLSTAFVLALYLFPSYSSYQQLSMGVALGVFISVVSYSTKLLAPSGAVMTFLLASLLYGLGGWQWTIPMVTFFLLSSFLSKAGKHQKASLETMFEKTGVRDYAQVAANGGVAGVLVILSYLFREINFYPLYLGAVAAVTADTWGTEIGLLTKSQPRLITSGKRVDRGTNGAVTLMGLGGSLLGSVVIVASAAAWIWDERLALGVVVAGLGGSLVDSLLGATVQAQYRCTVCSTATERRTHHDTPTELVHGLPWINNDNVNWACAATGALFMWIVTYLVK